MAEMGDINVQKLTIVQQAIASCCGAIITSLFVTPLDVIKTRLQAQSNPFHKGKYFVYSSGLTDRVYVCENGDSKAWHKKPGNFKGTLDAFVKIVRIEGIKSLWSGLPPTLIMTVPTTTIYFTCYDQLSEALRNRPGKHDEHIPVIAGSLSRFGSATVVSPLELIRTQMQYRRWSYKELYLCISTRLAVDGWISLWEGWTSTILRDVPFSGAASGSVIPQRDRKSTWAVMRKIVARNGIAGLFAAGDKKEKKEEQKKKGGREEKLGLDIAMKNNAFHCVKFSVIIKHLSWVLKLCLKTF
ncbi:solute carrier family 25 member 40 isoform X6 [Catharus ustulatus]|uniref:solute carrier family 25 member 40 isoform X6 n=1 Tax=Catharus ustulatus TaxID=91951 RepID=UPI001409CBC5|nr:solute carrier family 25 member 40 isoform X6 [Catharus ustulatus]